MNNTWKLSVLGGVALIASACVAAAGCTVTTTSGDLDSGTGGGGDSGTTQDAGGDTGTAIDSGRDGGASCAATAACPIIGTNVTFDNPSCGTCDTCMASQCCAETTACFTKTADGGQSACEQLFDCVAACEAADGGNTCNQACAAGNPDGVTPAQNLRTCQVDKCGATDAGAAACP